MPSPSQDSEKLTDAVAKIIAKAAGDALYNGGGKCINPEAFTEASRKVICEVERHRTPSVSGEDMRAEFCEKYLGSCVRVHNPDREPCTPDNCVVARFAAAIRAIGKEG